MADGYEDNFPGGGGDGSSGSFLGVPEGYSVFKPTGPRTPEEKRSDIYAATFGGAGPVTYRPKRGIYEDAGGVTRTPMYRSGDDLRTLSALSVEELARLQGRMASVGLIGPSTRFRIGVVDNATVSAYKTLLSTANRYGVTDSEALRMLAQTGELKGGEVTTDKDGNIVAAHPETKTTRQKTVTEPVYTDPATARQALRNVWQQSFGRDPSDAEMRRYAHRLRAAESGADVTAQTTKTHYDAEGTATSSVSHVTHQDDDTDPSPEIVAEQMSRRGKLGRERNNRMAATDYMGAILNLPGMSAG